VIDLNEYFDGSGISFNFNMSQGKSTIPDIHRGDGDGDGKNKSKDQTLCSSCDSCRAKKTKCDGKRPCEACMVSYVRRNKIGSADEVDVKKIKCVYSPAKRRGPPPKRTLEREMEERERERKQRREEEHPIAGLGRVPEEVVSSAANLNNLDTASILNLLSMLNPAASTLPPPMPPPIDPQQSLLSSLGNALAGIQGIGMPQGFGGGATASGGYNTMNNAPSAASQQLAYLQQLQQQLQLSSYNSTCKKICNSSYNNNNNNNLLHNRDRLSVVLNRLCRHHSRIIGHNRFKTRWDDFERE